MLQLKVLQPKTELIFFLSHLGAKIEIIDEVGEWIKIRIANGNSGWITKNNYRLL